MKKKTLKRLISMMLALFLMSFTCLCVFADGTDGNTPPAAEVQLKSIIDFESVETIENLLKDTNWETSGGTASIETEDENHYIKIASLPDAGNALLKYKFVGDGRPIASGQSFTLMYRISFDHDNSIGTGSSFRVALGDDAARGYFTSFYNSKTSTGDGAWSLQSEASTSNKAVKVGDFAHSVWHDVVWVYDASAPNSSTIYIDGMNAAEKPVFPRNGDTTPIGLCTSVDTQGGFSIRLDDIRVYSGVVDVWSMAETTAIDYEFNNLLSDPTKTKVSPANMNSDASRLTEVAGKFGKDQDNKAVYINNTVAEAGEDSYINFETNTNARFHDAGDSQSLSVNFAFDSTMRTVKLNGYAHYLADDGTIKKAKLTFNGLNVVEITPTNVRLFGENYPMDTALMPELWHNITLVINTNAESGAAATYSAYLNGKEICSEKIFANDTFIRLSNNPATYTSMSRFRGFSSFWLNYSWNSSAQTDVNGQIYRDAPGGIYFDDVKLTTYFGHKPVMDSAIYTLESGDWMMDKWIAGNTYYVKHGSTLETVKPILLENVTATYRNANGDLLDESAIVDGKAYGELRREGAVIGYICLDAQNNVELSDICNDAGNWTSWNRLDAENKTASQKGGKPQDDISLSLLNVEAEGNTGEGYIDYPLQNRSAGSLKNIHSYKPVTVSANVYMPEIEENKYFRISAWQGSAEESAESLQSKFGFANGKVYKDVKSSGGIGEEYCDYIPGEWNRVSYTFYPGENKMDIRINGTQIAAEEGIDVNVAQRLAVLRFETTYQKNPVYIDDIFVYTGYSIEEAYPQSVSAASGAELEVVSNTIKVPYWFVTDPYKISDLLTQLNYGGNFGVYSDHTFTLAKTNDSAVEYGDVLMFTAENTLDGKKYQTYKYYTVVPSEAFILTQDGSIIENGGTYTSGEITVTPYTSEGVMIIAVYDTSMSGSRSLESIETIELGSLDADSYSVTVNDSENTSVQVMVWDSIPGMKPLSAVYEANGSV
ncbi:LamG-like jellyroll fold domain-containing protein [Ructibacterium gallinarum]|uniref:Concanavalin A-like lectin/glucanases superfamily protein n=1 Tax=Ructibacterium gallinarum TaxID=2779355 RepID=A0A9D5LZA0_9FIRM|nr:LamG-like jellyroll fold domain-containing protein [Ructibacterium gallinarum]MBE5040801.1 hypothetical protein [Ructibacterium gallinarum]